MAKTWRGLAGRVPNRRRVNFCRRASRSRSKSGNSGSDARTIGAESQGRKSRIARGPADPRPRNQTPHKRRKSRLATIKRRRDGASRGRRRRRRRSDPSPLRRVEEGTTCCPTREAAAEADTPRRTTPRRTTAEVVTGRASIALNIAPERLPSATDSSLAYPRPPNGASGSYRAHSRWSCSIPREAISWTVLRAGRWRRPCSLT